MGSLRPPHRPGGATALLAACGSADEVRRRGRWLTSNQARRDGGVDGAVAAAPRGCAAFEDMEGGGMLLN